MTPLIHADLLRSAQDAFLAVYNYYGFGLLESVYCGALELELLDRGHRVAREMMLNVDYKGRHVSWQRVDFLVDDKLIIEVKATEVLPAYAERQLLNYLACSSI